MQHAFEWVERMLTPVVMLALFAGLLLAITLAERIVRRIDR
ncbi:MAG TPA: hypothetical protein VN513_09850 [Gemmatimonadales bacterium]|nr:hypothetical protein [Gemmatimonadales bacterium]